MSSIYTSAEPLIALLRDDDLEIRVEALKLLNTHVHEFWTQLAPEVSLVESLIAVPEIADIAALVAGKIYYHIDRQQDALRCVLVSNYLTQQLDDTVNAAPTGNTIMSTSPSDPLDTHVAQLDEQFQQAMIARAIEMFVKYQRQNFFYQNYLEQKENSADVDDDFTLSPSQVAPIEPSPIDPSIATLLHLLINRSLSLGEYTCALGLAIDTLRLDWLKHILVTVSAKNAAALMRDTFKIAIEIVDIHPFRQQLLRTLTDLYLTAPTALAQQMGSLTPQQSTVASDDKKDILADNDDEDDTLRPSKDTELHVVSDVLALCQCLLALNDSDQTAQILTQLISSTNQGDHLLAYQVAYDLTQNQQIAFTSEVASHIIASSSSTTSSLTSQQTAKVTQVFPKSTTAGRGVGGMPGGGLFGAMGGQGLGGLGGLGGLPSRSSLSNNTAASSNLPTVEPSDLEADGNVIEDIVINDNDQVVDQAIQEEARENLKNILTGVSSAMLHTHFYHRNNNTNDEWFAKLMSYYDMSNDQTAASQLYAGYAIAQSGTNRDGCIRNSWPIFDKLTEWSAFTARASLGNIYRGQFDSIKDILKPFLPNPALQSSTPGSERELGNYTHGGSLYAMGLAACGVTNNHIPYLQTILTQATINCDEPVQAGAALSLGLCAFGSGNSELFDLLRGIVWDNQPIAGLAAGIAIGLIYTGLSEQDDVKDIIAEIVPTARSNQHPNIQLGQGLGLALMYFNAQQGAESLLNELRSGALSSQYTRWLSCWVDAMAYCGTGNIKVVGRLLSLAVSDPDNDVKRTAIQALAFVLLNEPDQCITILEPLANSYNEHVRYAVAIAIGLVCSSSGLSQDEYSSTIVHALTILGPLVKDSNSSVVRQGGLIGYCMALQQTTSQSRYTEALSLIEDCFASKRTSSSSQIPTIYRVSAALGAGILHSSGMNSNIRLIAPVGNQRRTIAIAGMMLFCNYWNWYPLANMFSLALSPTAVIGTYFAPRSVNDASASTSTSTTNAGAKKPTTLRVAPKLRFIVKIAKESMRYPKREVDETKTTAKKVVVNTLSGSKRKGKDGSNNASISKDSGNNSSTNNASGLARTPSLRLFGSELTRSFSKLSDKGTPSTPTSKKDDEKKTEMGEGDKEQDDKDKDEKKKPTLSQLNKAILVRGQPLSSLDTTSNNTSLERQGSSTLSLDKPTLNMSFSAVEKKRKAKDDKIPVTVIQNCTRVLPRHIVKVSCPKGQQYEPIKKRLFGILVLKSNITPEQRQAMMEEEKLDKLLKANPSAEQQQQSSSSQDSQDDKNKDELATPPAITPGGDISRSEPSVPGPFSMNDE